MPDLAAPPAAPVAPAPSVPAAPAVPPGLEPANHLIGDAFNDLDQFASSPEDAAKPINQQTPAPTRGNDGKFLKKARASPSHPEKAEGEDTPEAPETPVAPKPPKAPEAPKDPPKPAEKPAEAPKPADKPPVTAPELRKAYETVKAERDTLKKEVETFRTAKPVEDPEKKQMAEKLTAAEKRLAQLDETLRFTNYERSEEYKSKYLQPFEQAYNIARKKVATLDVVERSIDHDNPDTGEKERKIIQKARPATEADFDQLAQIPDDRQARQLAKQLFGDDAPIAMQHREKVLELNETRAKALEDYQKTGADREKQAAEMTAKQRTEINSIWEQSISESIKKYPSLYAPAEGDEEGNTLLEKGFAMADRAFGDTSKMPPQELVKLHAQIRNRAAAFGRQVYLNKKQSTRISELEAQIKALEDSAPGAGEGGGKKPTGEADQYGESALDRYAHQV